MVTKKKNPIGKKQLAKQNRDDRFLLIEKALRKRKKADLVDLIINLAKTDAPVARDLERRLAIEKPVALLVPDVSSAIDRATNFDRRKVGYNFLCDWQAYEDVQRGLEQLIDLGLLEDAKKLALKLMRTGSYQVECSDEGIMTDDIQNCLKPVIQAVQDSDDKEAASWALEMLRTDRVGFICDEDLKQLVD